MQHFPFILVADTGAMSDDTATAASTIDSAIESGFMASSFLLLISWLDQSRDRLHIGATRKHAFRQRAFFDAQMIPEQAFEDGTQIGGRLQVAPFKELCGLQPR